MRRNAREGMRSLNFSSSEDEEVVASPPARRQRLTAKTPESRTGRRASETTAIAARSRQLAAESTTSPVNSVSTDVSTGGRGQTRRQADRESWAFVDALKHARTTSGLFLTTSETGLSTPSPLVRRTRRTQELGRNRLLSEDDTPAEHVNNDATIRAGRRTNSRPIVLSSFAMSLSKEEQERRDAELARRLQEEEDREAANRRPVEPTLTAEQLAAILSPSPVRARPAAVVYPDPDAAAARHGRQLTVRLALQGAGSRAARGPLHHPTLTSSDEDDMEDEFVNRRHSTPIVQRRRRSVRNVELADPVVDDDDNDDDEDDDSNMDVEIISARGRAEVAARTPANRSVVELSSDDDDVVVRRPPPDVARRDGSDLDDAYDGEMTLNSIDISDLSAHSEDNMFEDSHLNQSNRVYEADSFVVSDEQADESEDEEETPDSEESDSDSDLPTARGLDDMEVVSSDSDEENADIAALRHQLAASRARMRRGVEELRTLLMNREPSGTALIERILAQERADVPTPERTPTPEPDDTVIRSGDWGHCTICFEELPFDPVGCLYCQQMIGCRICLKRWIKGGERQRRADSPLSLGQSGNNHRQCPLCRHEWDGEPEVTSMFMLK